MPGLITTADRSDFQDAEERLVSELTQRAQQQIQGVNGPNDVHIRDIMPSEDLNVDDSNNVNGWTDTNREWLQSGLTADQLELVYEVDSSQRMENKVIGIFAVSSAAPDILTTEIVFEDGTGSRFERLVFQEAQTLSEGEYALMRNPVIFNEGKDGYIYLWPNDGGNEQLIFHGAVAEKAGTTLGTRDAGGTPNRPDAPSGVARRPGR